MQFSKAGILFVLVPLAHAQSYALVTFDPPGSNSSTVTGINNDGQVVGYYEDASGFHGFVRTGSTYTAIEVPDALPGRTFPFGINNRGEITGWFNSAAGTHGFIRSADGRTYTVFDAPDLVAGTTAPHAINDRGDVVGNGFAVGLITDGFLRRADGGFTKIQLGTNTDPMGINSAGEIAGYYREAGSAGFSRGFLRDSQGNTQTIDVPGIIGTQILGINNRGQITGRFGNSSLFVRNADGSFLYITPLGSQAIPAGINDSGTIAGSFGDGSARHGFLAVPSSLPNPRPTIRTERGVITAFAYGGNDAIAPGTWIEIYGSNLSRTTRQWTAADFNGDAAPTSLDGVSVRISGQPAFISYISPGQINAQVPSSIAPGTALVVITGDGQVGTATSVRVDPVQAGVLAFPQTRIVAREAVAIFPDNVTYALTPNSRWPVPSRLAHAGDTLTFYGIGFGPVSPDLPAGRIATQPAALPAPPRILFNGIPGTVTYAGLAPGYIGLYQFNVVVPAGAGRENNIARVTLEFEGASDPIGWDIGLAP